MARTEAGSRVDADVWRNLSWVGVAVQAAALVFVIWSQKWTGTWVLAGFLALSLLCLFARERLPSLFSFLFVLAAMVNAAGWAWNWFSRFVWYDEMAHFFPSFVVASALGWIGWKQGWIRPRPEGAPFVLAVALIGLGVGFLWEVAESLFLNLRPWDTAIDLVMDTAGGAAGGFFLSALLPRERLRA